MNRWLRRFFVAITVGGGFLGICSTLSTLVKGKQANPWTYVILVVVILLYAYAMFVGIRLSERRRPDLHFLICYFLQVPIFSSAAFGFYLFVGLSFAVGYARKFFWLPGLGSEWQLSFNQMRPLLGGINLFAIAALAYGFCYRRRGKRPRLRGSASFPSNRILRR